MITLTTTPLSTEYILVEWAYSTFDEITEVESSTDGITYEPITGSPFAKGTNTGVSSGLADVKAITDAMDTFNSKYTNKITIDQLFF